MSYYRYITGIYKSFWPELNRTLRSSSSPRHIPQPVPSRIERACSLPPRDYYNSGYFTGRVTARPFNERALSMPRQVTYSYDTRSIVSPARESETRYSVTPTREVESHYSDFDYKVINYMGQLAREDTVKTSVARSRYDRHRQMREVKTCSENFSTKYNYYDGNKHLNDYLYDCTKDVLGNFKHYNLSAETLRLRNKRSVSPLRTRELDRFFERKSNYMGDTSAGCSDFRHYNYRKTPYFGGSDDYSYMRRRPTQFSRGF